MSLFVDSSAFYATLDSSAVCARAALLLREAGRPREARLLIDRPLTGRVLFDVSNSNSRK